MNTITDNIRERYVNLWLLLLRIGVAGFRLTDWLPKRNRLLAGEPRFGDPLGIGPEFSLVLVILAEVGCSILIMIGLFTRLATIPLMFTMLVAAFVSHAGDPFSRKELPLLYFFTYITLCVLGSGKYSADFLLKKQW